MPGTETCPQRARPIRISLHVELLWGDSCPFEPRPGAWHPDVALRDRSDLLLRLGVVGVAQMREHIRDVGKLLFEIALVVLQPLDHL